MVFFQITRVSKIQFDVVVVTYALQNHIEACQDQVLRGPKLSMTPIKPVGEVYKNAGIDDIYTYRKKSSDTIWEKVASYETEVGL